MVTLLFVAKLYDFAVQNLSNTARDSKCPRRVFRYVKNIDRNRDRLFKSVKDNRKIHQVCSSISKMVKIRRLSCYSCDNCLNCDYENCLNDHQIGTSINIKLCKENEQQETQEDDTIDEEQPIYDLVSGGVIFVVKADDEDQPYYLVKATKQAVTLRKETTDKWGITFLPGTKVLNGYYFGIVNDNPLEQRLIRRIPAMVPAASVIYICSELELDADGIIKIDDTLHGRILRCLDD